MFTFSYMKRKITHVSKEECHYVPFIFQARGIALFSYRSYHFCHDGRSAWRQQASWDHLELEAPVDDDIAQSTESSHSLYLTSSLHRRKMFLEIISRSGLCWKWLFQAEGFNQKGQKSKKELDESHRGRSLSRVSMMVLPPRSSREKVDRKKACVLPSVHHRSSTTADTILVHPSLYSTTPRGHLIHRPIVGWL